MTDAFDLSAALIVNAPDVSDWPATAAITLLSFDGAVSRIAFTKQDGPDRWPDVVPPAFTGPIQYTWWLFRQLNGRWVGSGFIEMWFGRDGSGSPRDPDVPSVYHEHWFYGTRWAPLVGTDPIRPGESIGFMVTSGDARDRKGPYSVRERSNVVLVAATDTGSFTFDDAPSQVDPPAPQPTPTPTPPPSPGDLSAVVAAIVALTIQVKNTADAVRRIEETQLRGLQVPYLGIAKPVKL